MKEWSRYQLMRIRNTPSRNIERLSTKKLPRRKLAKTPRLWTIKAKSSISALLLNKLNIKRKKNWKNKKKSKNNIKNSKNSIESSKRNSKELRIFAKIEEIHINAEKIKVNKMHIIITAEKINLIIAKKKDGLNQLKSLRVQPKIKVFMLTVRSRSNKNI